MERVTGIGGFLFRSDDPSSLARWYAADLGVEEPPAAYEEGSWWQKAGPTVFAPMSSSADDHFGSEHQTWSINFRVADLHAMVIQLRGSGIEVAIHGQDYPNGRFAEMHDPDDSPIQLREPAGSDLHPPRPTS